MIIITKQESIAIGGNMKKLLNKSDIKHATDIILEAVERIIPTELEKKRMNVLNWITNFIKPIKENEDD